MNGSFGGSLQGADDSEAEAYGVASGSLFSTALGTYQRIDTQSRVKKVVLGEENGSRDNIVVCIEIPPNLKHRYLSLAVLLHFSRLDHQTSHTPFKYVNKKGP